MNRRLCSGQTDAMTHVDFKNLVADTAIAGARFANNSWNLQ